MCGWHPISTLLRLGVLGARMLSSFAGVGRTLVDVGMDGSWSVTPAMSGDEELTFRVTNTGSQHINLW